MTKIEKFEDIEAWQKAREMPTRNATRHVAFWKNCRLRLKSLISYRGFLRILDGRIIAKYSLLNESRQLFASKYLLLCPPRKSLSANWSGSDG